MGFLYLIFKNFLLFFLQNFFHSLSIFFCFLIIFFLFFPQFSDFLSIFCRTSYVCICSAPFSKRHDSCEDHTNTPPLQTVCLYESGFTPETPELHVSCSCWRLAPVGPHHRGMRKLQRHSSSCCSCCLSSVVWRDEIRGQNWGPDRSYEDDPPQQAPRDSFSSDPVLRVSCRFRDWATWIRTTRTGCPLYPSSCGTFLWATWPYPVQHSATNELYIQSSFFFSLLLFNCKQTMTGLLNSLSSSCFVVTLLQMHLKYVCSSSINIIRKDKCLFRNLHCCLMNSWNTYVDAL